VLASLEPKTHRFGSLQEKESLLSNSLVWHDKSIGHFCKSILDLSCNLCLWRWTSFLFLQHVPARFCYNIQPRWARFIYNWIPFIVDVTILKMLHIYRWKIFLKPWDPCRFYWQRDKPMTLRFAFKPFLQWLILFVSSNKNAGSDRDLDETNGSCNVATIFV